MLYFYGNSYKEAKGNKPVEIKTTEQLEGYKEVYSFVIPAKQYLVMYWDDNNNDAVAVFDVIADDEDDAEDIARDNGGDAYEDWPCLVENKEDWLDELEEWKEEGIYKEVR